jgi:hypothetical protein
MTLQAHSKPTEEQTALLVPQTPRHRLQERLLNDEQTKTARYPEERSRLALKRWLSEQKTAVLVDEDRLGTTRQPSCQGLRVLNTEADEHTETRADYHASRDPGPQR